MEEAPPQLTAANAPQSTVAIVSILYGFRTFGFSIVLQPCAEVFPVARCPSDCSVQIANISGRHHALLARGCATSIESSCAAPAVGVVPLSNRWSWTVILVEMANSHGLPVPQLPIIADSGRLARMLLRMTLDFCRAERACKQSPGRDRDQSALRRTQ